MYGGDFIISSTIFCSAYCVCTISGINEYMYSAHNTIKNFIFSKLLKKYFILENIFIKFSLRWTNNTGTGEGGI